MTVRPLNSRTTLTSRAVTRAVDSLGGGWYDPTTGLGQRGMGAAFCAPEPIDDTQLADLYEYDWLARKIVSLIVDDAWQDTIVIPDEEDAERWTKIDRYEGSDDGAFVTAAKWGRLYGLSLLVFGDDFAGPLDTPRPASAKPITWLEPVEGSVVEVLEQDLSQDPNVPQDFREPDFYRITGRHRFQGRRIHKSRVQVFYGPGLAGNSENRRRDRRWLAKGTLSALDTLQAITREFGMSWAAVSHLLQEASVPIWKLAGILNAIAAEDYASVRARFQLQQELVGVNRAIILDPERGEEYRRESASVNDLPGIIQQLAFKVCAATGIPCGKLFGHIVGGLGDAGTDNEQWLQSCTSFRTRILEPRLWSTMAAAGIDEWAWKPLGEPGPEKQAQIDKTRADTTRAWYEMVDVPAQLMADLAATALGIEPWIVPPAQEENNVVLAPTDVARIMTVREARASQGLLPLGDPRDDLFLSELESSNAPPAPAEQVAPVVTDSRYIVTDMTRRLIAKACKMRARDWDPDQPRDEAGRWGAGGYSARAAGSGRSKAEREAHAERAQPQAKAMAREMKPEIKAFEKEQRQLDKQAAKLGLDVPNADDAMREIGVAPADAADFEEIVETQIVGAPAGYRGHEDWLVESNPSEVVEAAKEYAYGENGGEESVARDGLKLAASDYEDGEEPNEKEMSRDRATYDARKEVQKAWEVLIRKGVALKNQQVKRLKGLIDGDSDGRTGAAEKADDRP